MVVLSMEKENALKLTERVSETTYKGDSIASNVEAFIRDHPHIRPVHKMIIPSLLSKESPQQNYRGLFNLYVLLLGVINFRMVIENYRKYGFLISLPGTLVPSTDYIYLVLCLTWVIIQVVFGLYIEIMISKSTLIFPSIRFAKVINVGLTLVIPIFIVWYGMYHFVIGLISLGAAIIVSMKLVSYHVVNYELRLANKKGFKDIFYLECPYPQNITIGNLAYFMIAPTLCYQPIYPKTKTFRWTFFLKNITQFACALTLMYCVLEQYAVPTVKNSIRSIDEFDILLMIERILKFSVSNIYIWLLFFYMFFDALANALSEVLKFGDRKFYDAWWNAQSMGEYWRQWNLPFHLWMKRHVYEPCRVYGFSNFHSMCICFILSAFLHEIIVGVPAHVIHLLSFGGIIMQIPLIIVTDWYVKRFPRSSLGNYFFWISFCVLGQPTAAILYHRAWLLKYA